MEAARIPGAQVTVTETTAPTQAERIPGAQVTITETEIVAAGAAAPSRFFMAS